LMHYNITYVKINDQLLTFYYPGIESQ
jgi:hypothetical protein